MNTIKSTRNWSDNQITLLYEIFPYEKKAVVIDKIGKKWNAICQMALRKKIKRKCKYKKTANWTDEDVEKLIKLYPISTPSQLRKEFPSRSLHSLEVFASNRGLKKDLTIPFSRGRKGDLRILLEEKNESYYWIGFIFADGYIHHKSHHLVLFIDEFDKNHLQKYANYIKGNIKCYTEIKKFPNNPEYISNMCRVAVAQKNIVPQLIRKFDFKPTKTYNPPNSDVLFNVLNTKEKFLSFLCGFIDGDGSTYDWGISIENHASWIHIHEMFIKKLINFLNFTNDDFLIEINKRGYSKLKIRNKTNLSILKREINTLQIPLLKRKWNKIDENGKCKHDVEINNLNIILENIKMRLTIPEIANKLNKSENCLRSYIHRKNIKYNRINKKRK